MRSMNKLASAKRIQILSMLVEGASMRSIARVADVSINTVSKMLVDAGNRRLAKDLEMLIGTSTAMAAVATVQLLVRRLARY